MPTLYKKNEPSVGDSGSMSMLLTPSTDENGRYIVKTEYGRPKVGSAIRVGSLVARSYSYQDWWQTSIIKKIILDTPDMVEFETVSGSVYVWRA